MTLKVKGAIIKGVEALLFDLDGTLWNTSESCVETWNKALFEFDFDRAPFTEKEIASIMGKHHKEILDTLFPGIDYKKADECIEQCYYYHKEAIRSGRFYYYDSVLEGLEKLRHSYKIFLVSNCDREYMDIFLDRFPFDCFIDDICHGDHNLSKAENIKLIMKNNFIRKALYIGDTPTDQAAAESVFVPFIWASYGFDNTLNYPKKIDHFSELEELLKEF